MAAKNADPLSNGLGQLTKTMETGAQDWSFSCGHCHAGGGQMEYDRDRNPYSSSSPSGDRYYFKPPTLDNPTGGIVETTMSDTNKGEVDCLMCHIDDGSGQSGNGRAFLQSMGCGNPYIPELAGIQLGPNNDPNCGYALAPNGTDPALTDPSMMARNGAGMFVVGTKFDTFNRTLAVQDSKFNYAASLGLGAKATLSMAADGHLTINGVTNAPTSVSNAHIAATPASVNCVICHGRDDNTPGLPGMMNPVRYGYGAYLIINPQATTLDVDPGTQLADGSNDVRWMEMGCKTGMGKRGDKTGHGPNDKWGLSMFSAMFGLGKGPGMPILTESFSTPLGALNTTAKMPDEDVHDGAGMRCATCHYSINGTIEAETHHGVAFPLEEVLAIDHNFAQGDVLKDGYGRNNLDGTVSCEGCHTTRTHPKLTDNGGSLVSPTPGHSSFPAVHIQKIGCTTCHIPEIYITPFKLKYRDFTVGKFKRGTETAGGNKNIYDFSYNFVTDSGDATKQLHQWANKNGETKIYPTTPIEVGIWTSGINGGAGQSSNVIAGTTPLATALDPANNNLTNITNTGATQIKTCAGGPKAAWACSTDADCPSGTCVAGNFVKSTPSMSRDVTDVAVSTLADCDTDPTGAMCSVRINGGSMVPVFDNWVLTDNLSMDTIAKRAAMRAKSQTLFTSGSGKQLGAVKIFHAAFDETHGVPPKEWALGAPQRGGCVMCHSSANSMNPDYSPYSVGFFEGVQPYTEKANQFVPASNAPLSDQLVPAIGNMFVGKFDLMKNPMAMFADFDCAQTFCGVGTCGGGDCSTANVYGVPGLDMLGSMMVGAGAMDVPTAIAMGMSLTPDSYYFDQMTNALNDPNAACSPYSPLYDLTPMGMPGMGITTIGQCTALMNAGFDAMMGLPHSVDATLPVGNVYSTAGMMGFSDGIAGLQGLMLRETQDGTNMGCNPMAGPYNQAAALGFPVNVNNCMPSPTFVAPTAGMIGFDMPVGAMFAGTCTDPNPDYPTYSTWPMLCNGGFRDGQGCAPNPLAPAGVNADCKGNLPDSEAMFQFGKDPFGSLGSLMYTRSQQRTHNKTVLQTASASTDLTWPIFVDKNPGNPAHVAAWDQATKCLTNYGFMGPEVPCGTTGTGYCTGQDGTSADKCVNVKTFISTNDLLGYDSAKLAVLANMTTMMASSDCTHCHTQSLSTMSHPTGTGSPTACSSCHTTQHESPINPIVVDTACGSCHGGSAGAGATTNGAPYLSSETAALYAPLMHSGSNSGTVVQTGAEPVLPPTPGSCDSSLTADGSVLPSTGTTATVFTLTDTTTQDHSLHIYWGDGTGITSTATHSYNNIGTYQIIQTVTNPCGYRSQKVHIVTVTGGTTGKGTMSLSATGTVGSKLSYSVLNSSGVSITNGSITVGSAAKVITLDGGAYGVKIGYSPVAIADPIVYKTCDLLTGAADVAKCSRPGYADQASCEAALHVWQITGQQASGIAVSGGADTAVTLTNCN